MTASVSRGINVQDYTIASLISSGSIRHWVLNRVIFKTFSRFIFRRRKSTGYITWWSVNINGKIGEEILCWSKMNESINVSFLSSQVFVAYNFLNILLFLYKCCLRASVDTEMCCPKGKCGCQYFILLTLKTNHGHRGPGLFY